MSNRVISRITPVVQDWEVLVSVIHIFVNIPHRFWAFSPDTPYIRIPSPFSNKIRETVFEMLPQANVPVVYILSAVFNSASNFTAQLDLDVCSASSSSTKTKIRHWRKQSRESIDFQIKPFKSWLAGMYEKMWLISMWIAFERLNLVC